MQHYRRLLAVHLQMNRSPITTMRLVSYLFVPLLVLAGHSLVEDSLPTLYEYYTSGGIQSGLTENGTQFLLNGKPFVIFSGSFHYFRVVPEYWARTLQRFKAAGLNSVQLYIGWNLHESIPDQFDFDSAHINLANFLEEIKRADMFAIVRPGPYICAEWEMGGLPSWLLRDPNMRLRSDYPPYLERVKLYWEQVFSIINKYQFTSGGPVIFAQIENEYFGAPMNHSLSYLRYLLQLTRTVGFREKLFTSDNIDVAINDPVRSLPSLLETANLNDDAYVKLMKLLAAQPGRPLYTSEFWAGWYDSWKDATHNTYAPLKMKQQAEAILFEVGSSLNIYPMIGGTNFGFYNGALDDGGWTRVVTSYDYDAPLTESGNYTKKYHIIRQLYDRLVQTGRLPRLRIPAQPPAVQKTTAYAAIRPQSYWMLDDLLPAATSFANVPRAVTMELLEVGPGYGQRFGFVLYRLKLDFVQTDVKTFEVTGPLMDRAIFSVDSNEIVTLQDAANFSTLITPEQWSPLTAKHTIDLLVENQGRPNWGYLEPISRKGIQSDILIDGVLATDLNIYSLDFNRTFIEHFNNQTARSFTSGPKRQCPTLQNAELIIEAEPQDTFMRLDGWTKGNVFVNGFNIGRYWNVGPTKTLYIPAPLLKRGVNRINIFELHTAGREIHFLDHPILG